MLCQDHRMARPTVCIVSPARAADNNGNWHTAARWRAHLEPLAEVRLLQQWDGQDADLLVALHARRSAESAARFHEALPHRRLVVVLTGTDVYRDIAVDPAARATLRLAHRLVCLQARALDALDADSRAKACVIVQGATPVEVGHRSSTPGQFLAVGHLRAEKDPATLFRAIPRLPASLQVLHIGAGLDEGLAREAEALARALPQYRWLGPLPHPETRRHIAQAGALVHMSRMEGGANVVIEAIVSGTPVLASRIDGNLGLLGDAYAGYFPPGDDAALAELMARFHADAALRSELAAQCAARAPRYTLAAECAAVRALLPAA